MLVISKGFSTQQSQFFGEGQNRVELVAVGLGFKMEWVGARKRPEVNEGNKAERPEGRQKKTD